MLACLLFRSAALFFDSGVFLLTFNPLVRSSVSEGMDWWWCEFSLFFSSSINLDLIRFTLKRIQTAAVCCVFYASLFFNAFREILFGLTSSDDTQTRERRSSCRVDEWMDQLLGWRR